jgi:hypothetical protein
MTDKPTIRALTVFASVATRGPITLARLTALHPEISRTAIWRALDNLRAAGWVRDRLGDGAWLATHAADDILGNATIPPRAVEELAARLSRLGGGGEITIGTFTALGRFEIVEATDPTRIGEVLPLIGEPMAFSALASTEEADMLRHLKRWMDTDADPEERALITSGGLAQGLRAARKNPALRMDTGHALPHRAADGSVAVAWVAHAGARLIFATGTRQER